MLLEDIDERNSVLAAIIDSSDDAIISKTLDGIITSWNKAAERMFGYTEDEAKGKSITILIPEERQAEEDMIIMSLRAGKKIDHYETWRRTKSGEQIPISLTVSPIRNSKGMVVGASKIARNISRQKKAEEMLRQYTSRLEIIISTGKMIGADLDLNSILQKVTDATTQLSGAAFGAFFYNKTDGSGESYTLFTISGAPREAFEKMGMPRNTQVFDMTFSGKGIVRSDDITKDPRYGRNTPLNGMPHGHLPVVSYMAVPVISKTGTVIGGLFFGHPKPGMFKEEHESLVAAIASQAGIALDNAKLYEDIRQMNAKKDEFIGFASHELKTPVTTISGYIQLAEQCPEKFNDYLPKVSKQVSRLSSIISDLLDISKIHAGNLYLNFSAVNLQTIIRESVETAKQLYKSHIVECDIPKEDIVVHVDGQKVGQVLINLLTNAAKFSPKEKVITLKAYRMNDQVKIEVRDQGIGIGQEHIDKIFSRFYRVLQEAEQIQGLGLGLYISREIIERHRGRIWAESEPGKGSTFHILIPES